MAGHLRRGSAVTRKIARNGTPEEPVYLVVQPDGGRALKSRGEQRR